MSPNPFKRFRILKRMMPSTQGNVFASIDSEYLWPNTPEEREIASVAKAILPFDNVIEGEDLDIYLNLCEDLWEEAYGKIR